MLSALEISGYAQVMVEARRKGDPAWDPAVLNRPKMRGPQELLVPDLGSRPDTLLPGVSTLLIDHHPDSRLRPYNPLDRVHARLFFANGAY